MKRILGILLGGLKIYIGDWRDWEIIKFRPIL